MAFSPRPLIPGDLHAAAVRLARDAMVERARHADAADRASALEQVWQQVQALGWPLLMRPEAAGGAEGTLEDLAALVDGVAQEGLPLPLVAVCGVSAILLGADSPAALASDGTMPAPVLDAYAPWIGNADAPSATLMPGGTLRLSGRARSVEIPGGDTAFLIACPVEQADAVEPGLILLESSQRLRPPPRFERLDGRVVAELHLSGIELPADALLKRGPAVHGVIAAALDVGAFLSCVEAQAALGSALALVIGYLADRNQFGAPLSTLQALRHKVSEIYVTYETLRAAVLSLLRAAGPGGRLPPRAVALAKLQCGRAVRRAAEKIIQLHGGMGMTEELPVTGLNKRLMMVEFEYGDAAWHAQRALAMAA